MDAINFVHTENHFEFPWIVQWDANRCRLCGMCTAACSFRAIEPAMERREMATSELDSFALTRESRVVPVIRQVDNLEHYCRGCGICQKVCPNSAIRPVANTDHQSRFPVMRRTHDGDPIKRGGRSNTKYQPVRTLDTIQISRISQITDPSLDSLRHEFDLSTTFGRVLRADELSMTTFQGNMELTEDIPPVRRIYPIIFADMSIGALSWRMWEAIALAVSYLNEVHNLPVRMCTGEGGVPPKLLTSDFLKYVILQIASGHFGWNRIITAMPKMKVDPCGVIIKYGQGAKPGDGGFLPAEKVAKHIQMVRGVPRSDLNSPPTHQGLYSIEEAIQKMVTSMSSAFGYRVPVGVKVAASSTSIPVLNNLTRDPYRIVGGFFMDGIEGGTGAALGVSLDHTGHPIATALRDCYLAQVAQGRQGTIPLFAGGGIGKTGELAADAVKMTLLGASGVFVGKILLQAAGCLGTETGRCNACNTGSCPVGICTQNPRLVRRLDVDTTAERITNLMLATDAEMRKVLAQIGNNLLPVGRSDAVTSVDESVAARLQIKRAC